MQGRTININTLSHLKLAVLELKLKHSSLERILCEKYFPSGSNNLAIVCAYKRTPNVHICNSYMDAIFFRNESIPGLNLV